MIVSPGDMESFQERFEAKVADLPTDEGCWIWTAGTNGGYGWFGGPGGPLRAHRMSWLLYRGPIPDGMHVCHKCDVRRCVNPDHLFLGTNSDNVADRVAKGRTRVGTGERHGLAKLDATRVVEIRLLRAKGARLRELAAQFGISKSQASKVCNRQFWTTIPEPA